MCMNTTQATNAVTKIVFDRLIPHPCTATGLRVIREQIVQCGEDQYLVEHVGDVATGKLFTVRSRKIIQA